MTTTTTTTNHTHDEQQPIEKSTHDHCCALLVVTQQSFHTLVVHSQALWDRSLHLHWWTLVPRWLPSHVCIVKNGIQGAPLHLETATSFKTVLRNVWLPQRTTCVPLPPALLTIRRKHWWFSVKHTWRKRSCTRRNQLTIYLSLDVNLIHKHLLLICDPVAVLSSWGEARRMETIQHSMQWVLYQVLLFQHSMQWVLYQVPLLSISSMLRSRLNSFVIIINVSDDSQFRMIWSKIWYKILAWQSKLWALSWSNGWWLGLPDRWSLAEKWYADYQIIVGMGEYSGFVWSQLQEWKQYQQQSSHLVIILLLPALYESFPAYEFLHRLAPH